MTRERNISCTQPSRQQNAGGATDAQTPTPPAACDRNALSALWNLGSNNLTVLTFKQSGGFDRSPRCCKKQLGLLSPQLGVGKSTVPVGVEKFFPQVNSTVRTLVPVFCVFRRIKCLLYAHFSAHVAHPQPPLATGGRVV